MAAIMVLTAGSTGDVEPFAVLAGVLASRGHTVTLAADAGLSRWSLAVGSSSHPFGLISTHFYRHLSVSGRRFAGRCFR